MLNIRAPVFSNTCHRLLCGSVTPATHFYTAPAHRRAHKLAGQTIRHAYAANLEETASASQTVPDALLRTGKSIFGEFRLHFKSREKRDGSGL